MVGLGDEDAAGFEVGVIGEAVGSVSQDLEQVAHLVHVLADLCSTSGRVR